MSMSFRTRFPEKRRTRQDLFDSAFDRSIDSSVHAAEVLGFVKRNAMIVSWRG